VDGLIAILSHDRPETVRKHPLLPHAVLVVDEDELDRYAGLEAKEIVGCPPMFNLGALRQWVLDTLWSDHRYVWFSDDDIVELHYLMARQPHTITDPAHMLAVIDALAQVAEDMGAYTFGCNEFDSIWYRTVERPFRLRSVLCGYQMGVTRHAKGKRLFRVANAEDYDACLTSIAETGLSLSDQRYHFWGPNNLPGGNTFRETTEIRMRVIDELTRLWGSDVIRFAMGADGLPYVKVRIP